MADIELVIRIPEDVYKQCILAKSLFEVQLVNYIANGTPLPPHGRLIDADALQDAFYDKCEGECYYCDYSLSEREAKEGRLYECDLINKAPTIEIGGSNDSKDNNI